MVLSSSREISFVLNLFEIKQKKKKRSDLQKVGLEVISHTMDITRPSGAYVTPHNDSVTSGNWFMVVVKSAVAIRRD
jgi:hypothetical protein